jgi:hypothetical protein
MTAEQFNTFWKANYPDTIPIPYYFKQDYADRWFRIHSLPASKRYADTEEEWKILLDRHNKIITDLLGDNSPVLLVTGDNSSEGVTELHPLENVNSIAGINFISLEPLDLNKLRPGEYDKGEFYKPVFSEQTWQPKLFDNLLKDIADDQLKAFFISINNNCIVAPYDGGIDLILKDEKTKNIYKEKYKEWLPAREDGL